MQKDTPKNNDRKEREKEEKRAQKETHGDGSTNWFVNVTRNRANWQKQKDKRKTEKFWRCPVLPHIEFLAFFWSASQRCPCFYSTQNFAKMWADTTFSAVRSTFWAQGPKSGIFTPPEMLATFGPSPVIPLTFPNVNNLNPEPHNPKTSTLNPKNQKSKPWNLNPESWTFKPKP